MNPSNYRVLNTDKGYAVFRVYYDSYGSPVRHDPAPVIDFYSSSTCGLLDQIESIELAFEKQPLDAGDINTPDANKEGK